MQVQTPVTDQFVIRNTSWIEISRSALQNNLRYIHSIIGDRVQYSAVIKGNAYGHGIEEMIPMLEDAGVAHFSVFSAYEAWRAYKVKSDSSTLMVMGELDDEDAIEWAIAHQIEFFVFDFVRLEMAGQVAKRIGQKARVHIELETGMHRTGFDEKKLNTLSRFLKEHVSCIEVVGFTTHYAGAENIANHSRVNKQISKFQELAQKMARNRITPHHFHTACSAATINFPNTHMDMVRIGILMYGFWPSKESFVLHIARKSKNRPNDPLKRVMSWKTRVMSTKKVKIGEFIGYGTSYLAERDMTIAAIPVGYSYGFSRSLSNYGNVLIHGKKVPVVGKVNMNMMLVDVSTLRGVRKYDEVVLIGDQGRVTNTVASFSEMSNLLNYELLTRLPRDIPRVVVD